MALTAGIAAGCASAAQATAKRESELRDAAAESSVEQPCVGAEKL